MGDTRRRVERTSSHYIVQPDGDNFEAFKQSVKHSVGTIARAIEDIEFARMYVWEDLVFSGTWSDDATRRAAGGKLIAPDTAILRGSVTADSGAHATDIGTLPPRLAPRVTTTVLTYGLSGSTPISVILTIAPSGIITPVWFSAPGASFSVALENILLGLS